jgi:hypothetical protein
MELATKPNSAEVDQEAVYNKSILGAPLSLPSLWLWFQFSNIIYQNMIFQIRENDKRKNSSLCDCLSPPLSLHCLNSQN